MGDFVIRSDRPFWHGLKEVLSHFDNRSTQSLEAWLDELPEARGLTEEVAQELLELTAIEPDRFAAAATWMLKALLERGLVLERKQVARLARTLDALTDPWAALHVCQSMRFFLVPARNASQFARFLERCASSDQKFLRAWSVDGYWRLSQAHERLLPRALELLEQGANDPAASVKARVRNIRRDI